MQFKTFCSAISLTLLLFATPVLADSNNYNPIAGGAGEGEAYANCSSALFTSCDSPPINPVSAAPSPEISGSLALIVMAGVAVGLIRKRNRKVGHPRHKKAA